MNQTFAPFAPFALTLVALTLAACGGGGGSTPTPVITYTSATTCAGGAALTSTVSQAAANALVPASCPAATAAQLAAITVTRAVAAPSAITAAGLPAGWTLTGGTATFTPIAPTTGAAVIGSISTTGVITPNGILPSGSYTVTANLTFANAPATSVTRTVIVPTVYVPPTIAQVDVVNPPRAAGTTVWVEGSAGIPTGAVVHRIDAAHRLASLQTQIGDADWWSKMMDGSITQWTTQMTQVGAPTPLDGAIRMTMYTSGNSLGSNVCIRPVLVSTGLNSENAPSTNYFGCTAAVNGFVWAKVTNNAIYEKSVNHGSNQCTKVDWNSATLSWRVTPITDAINCQP